MIDDDLPIPNRVRSVQSAFCNIESIRQIMGNKLSRLPGTSYQRKRHHGLEMLSLRRTCPRQRTWIEIIILERSTTAVGFC